MTASSQARARFGDFDVNVKIRLAGLWVALMFFYVYRDVLGFMEPGHVEDLLAGVRMTEAVLLGSAVLMAIPSVMVSCPWH
jgi:hypothetical protein